MMWEQIENDEQEIKENKEEDTDSNLQPAGDTADRPPEDDREPGSDGEEVQVHRSTTDVLEATEEAESESVGNSTATVKVVLVPDGHVMTVAFAIGLSIQKLKLQLAAELRVPAEVLQISLDGRLVEEQQNLMELGVHPHGSTRMEMSSTNPTIHPLCPLRPPEHDNMPDVITVRVQTDEGVFQEVVVEIERPRQQKAFLGGYRHRLTGVEYHHAATKTLPKRRPDRGVVVFSRETQTVELRSQGQQCPVDVSTQTTRIGYHISCINDKLITPGKYVTADEYHDKRLKAVILLQSFARRWLAQQKVDLIKRDRGRRLHRCWRNLPRMEDLNLQYHALEKWRCEEEQRINSSLQGAERKAALCLLLEQETQHIAAIGQHHHTIHDKTIRRFLDKSAAPHQWRAADGRLIEMDTQNTIRARKLRDLYNDISQFSKEQRLQVLQTLRDTVKEHDCQLTWDIVELIDREVDLMTRGFDAASLGGLRQRISTLFLQYIKKTAFNPEVAKLLKNPSKLKNDMFMCRCCHRFKRDSDFLKSAVTHLRARCRDCTGLDNVARSRKDLSCYKNILSRLRADEQQLNEESKIPFLLQVQDMQYLMEVVWRCRSALSEKSDLQNLVFVRWERRRDWSPWNCILLIKEEAIAHLEVEDIHQVYATPFIQRIKRKHMVAQCHFKQIPAMAECLDSQLSTARGNLLVCKPVTVATGKHNINTPPASGH